MLGAATGLMSSRMSVQVYSLNHGVTRCNFNSLLAHNALQLKGVTLSWWFISNALSLSSTHYSPNNSFHYVDLCDLWSCHQVLSLVLFYIHAAGSHKELQLLRPVSLDES